MYIVSFLSNSSFSFFFFFFFVVFFLLLFPSLHAILDFGLQYNSPLFHPATTNFYSHYLLKNYQYVKFIKKQRQCLRSLFYVCYCYHGGTDNASYNLAGIYLCSMFCKHFAYSSYTWIFCIAWYFLPLLYTNLSKRINIQASLFSVTNRGCCTLRQCEYIRVCLRTQATARLGQHHLLHIGCAKSINYRLQAYEFLVQFVIHKWKNALRQDNNCDRRVAFAS